MSGTRRSVRRTTGGRAGGAAGLVGAAVAAIFLLTGGRPALAQQASASALAKSDIVRLLAAQTRTQNEIAEIIARSCLTFRPSPKDMRDFRQLGASDAVVSAIESCASPSRGLQSELRRVSRRARPPNRKPQPAPAPLTSDVRPAAAEMPVGSNLSITVTLRRGGEPASGVPIALEGDLPPGSRALKATTDAEGRAVFLVPAGSVPGPHVLTLTSPLGNLSGTDSIRIVATPGAPARAEVHPDRLVLLGQPERHRHLEILVRDSLFNPVPDEPVALWAGNASGAVVGNRATTDRAGRASFEISDDDLAVASRVQVIAGGRPIAEVPVLRPDSSQVRISLQPVASAGNGPPDSVAVRLTGPRGLPLPGVQVRFDAEPGPAEPSEARTDADGRVAVALPAKASESGSIVTVRAGPMRRSLRIGGVELPLGAYDAIRALRRESPNGMVGWTRWVALGRAYSETDQPARAREAYQNALAAAPSRDAARRRIDLAGGMPPLADVSLGGEARYAGGSAADLAYARIEVWPAAGVHVWGLYDRSLLPGLPILVRGPDPIRSYLAGGSVSYGSLGRLRTSLEVGRREEPLGFNQNYARLDQFLGFSLGRRPAAIRFGALVGRWYDRDDWAVYTSLELPLGAEVQLRPAIYVGRLVGTDFQRAGPRAARDQRGYVGVVYSPGRLWRVELAMGEGSVKGDLPSLSGHIFDSYVRILIPVTSTVRLRLLSRRQSPPDAEAFTAFDASLVVGVM